MSFSFLFADSSSVLMADGQNSVKWEDFGDTSQTLIASVTGTGITGSWLAPENGGSSNSTFEVALSPTELFRLSVHYFDYSETPVNAGGLEANGYALGQIIIQDVGANQFGFTALPESGSAIDYLTDYIGSYDVSFSADMYDIGDNNSQGFTITNVTISEVTSAVPEPASAAALLGGIALAGAALRRRRRSDPIRSAVMSRARSSATTFSSSVRNSSCR